MRLDVLSEMPRPWAAQVMRWRRINRAKRKAIDDGRIVPDNNEEYFLYQTLGRHLADAGRMHRFAPNDWALSREERLAYIARIQEYMEKAVHEGKINLSWINPNQEYSEALRRFVARILSPGSPGQAQQLPAPDARIHTPPGMVRGAQLAGANLAQADLAGGARRLPGTGAFRFQPGRSRQPARGEFCDR